MGNEKGEGRADREFVDGRVWVNGSGDGGWRKGRGDTGGRREGDRGEGGAGQTYLTFGAGRKTAIG